MKDLMAHGYTGGCPRCADLEYGRTRTRKEHSEQCRMRFYDIYKATEDAQWARAARYLQSRMSRGGDLHQPNVVEPDDVGLDAVGDSAGDYRQ